MEKEKKRLLQVACLLFGLFALWLVISHFFYQQRTTVAKAYARLEKSYALGLNAFRGAYRDADGRVLRVRVWKQKLLAVLPGKGMVTLLPVNNRQFIARESTDMCTFHPGSQRMRQVAWHGPEQDRLFQRENATSGGLQNLPGPVGDLLYHRYYDNGDGTITDAKTGLMWTQQDSYADVDMHLGWHEARQYVHSLRTGGHADWRMPTAAELLSLYDSQHAVLSFTRHTYEPVHICPVFAPYGAYTYWSSEKTESDRVLAVNFRSGLVHDVYVSYKLGRGVRAVRRANLQP